MAAYSYYPAGTKLTGSTFQLVIVGGGGGVLRCVNQGQMLIIVLSQAYTVDTKEH